MHACRFVGRISRNRPRPSTFLKNELSICGAKVFPLAFLPTLKFVLRRMYEEFDLDICVSTRAYL